MSKITDSTVTIAFETDSGYQSTERFGDPDVYAVNGEEPIAQAFKELVRILVIARGREQVEALLQEAYDGFGADLP